MNKQEAAAEIAELKEQALATLAKACVLAEEHEIEFEVDLTGTAPTTYERGGIWEDDNGYVRYYEEIADELSWIAEQEKKGEDCTESIQDLRDQYGDDKVDLVKNSKGGLPWNWTRWVSSSEMC